MKKENDIRKNKQDEKIDVFKNTLPGDKAIRRCRKKRVSLKRALGVPGIFSIAYGNLGSTIYFALGITAAHALGATPLVFIISAVFFVFTALTYAEGTTAIPEAGGSSSFARKGFNELVSFIAAWCLLLSYISIIAISASYAVSYLSYLKFFEVLKVPNLNIAARGMLLFLLAVINVIGVRKSSILNVIFAAIDVSTQCFLVIVGALFFFNGPKLLSQIHWGVAPTWPQLAMALYLVTLSFTGIETISNLAEESKTPEITVPKSMWWSVGIIIVVFLGLSSISMCAMPAEYQVQGYAYGVTERIHESETIRTVKKINYYKEIDGIIEGEPLSDALVKIGDKTVRTDENGYFTVVAPKYGINELYVSKIGYSFERIPFDNRNLKSLTVNGKWTTELAEKWSDKPISGIVDKLPIFKKPLGIWVSILAFTILVIATNSGILGVSRLVFSMGQYRQIPPILASLHPKFRTPYVAILIFTVVAFLIILPGNVENVAHVYAFAAMISYAIAHISIIALRIRHPEMNRPYRIPGNLKINGREIPITAVLGALVCFLLWIIVIYTKEYGRNVGIPFILIGILIYIFYRNSQGLQLMETIDPNKRR